MTTRRRFLAGAGAGAGAAGTAAFIGPRSVRLVAAQDDNYSAPDGWKESEIVDVAAGVIKGESPYPRQADYAPNPTVEEIWEGPLAAIQSPSGITTWVDLAPGHRPLLYGGSRRYASGDSDTVSDGVAVAADEHHVAWCEAVGKTAGDALETVWNAVKDSQDDPILRVAERDGVGSVEVASVSATDVEEPIGSRTAEYQALVVESSTGSTLVIDGTDNYDVTVESGADGSQTTEILRVADVFDFADNTVSAAESDADELYDAALDAVDETHLTLPEIVDADDLLGLDGAYGEVVSLPAVGMHTADGAGVLADLEPRGSDGATVEGSALVAIAPDGTATEVGSGDDIGYGVATDSTADNRPIVISDYAAEGLFIDRLYSRDDGATTTTTLRSIYPTVKELERDPAAALDRPREWLNDVGAWEDRLGPAGIGGVAGGLSGGVVGGAVSLVVATVVAWIYSR